MSSKSEYIKICIETLEKLALKDDIEAIVLLIEENYQKQKWTSKLAKIVLTGADEGCDPELAERIAAIQKKAARQLLRLTKKMSDEAEITVESIKEIRNM